MCGWLGHGEDADEAGSDVLGGNIGAEPAGRMAGVEDLVDCREQLDVTEFATGDRAFGAASLERSPTTSSSTWSVTIATGGDSHHTLEGGSSWWPRWTPAGDDCQPPVMADTGRG